MKKIIIVFISISFVFSFISCKNNNISNSGISTKDRGKENSDTAADTGNKEPFESEFSSILDLSEHVTLKFCVMGVGDEFDAEVLQELNIRTNEKLNADIDIQVINVVNGIAADQIVKKLNAGEVFDTFVCKAGRYQDRIKDKEITDKLLDIKEILPEYAPNLYLKYSDSERECFMDEGRMIILKDISSLSAERMVVTVNKSNLEKYKIVKINTLEDYEKYLDAVKKDKGYVNCEANFIGPVTDYFYRYIYGYEELPDHCFVYKKDDPDMTIIPWIETEEFKESFITYKRFKDKGYTNMLPEGYNLYAQSDGVLTKGYVLANLINSKYPGRYVTFPLYPDMSVSEDPDIEINNPGSILGFNKNAENPERFMLFINWVFTDRDMHDLLVYGIEGSDYKLDDKGRIEPIMNYEQLTGQQIFADATYESSWTGSSAGGMQFFKNPAFLRPTIYMDEDYYKELYEFDKKTTVEPLHYKMDIWQLPSPLPDKWVEYIHKVWGDETSLRLRIDNDDITLNDVITQVEELSGLTEEMRICWQNRVNKCMTEKNK